MKETGIFNRPFVVTEGWYWLLPAKQLKRGKTRAIHIMGRELVLYRGANNQVVALDAYCPHMGAHLAEGKVEGNHIRCFFHNWQFNAKGQCTDIPCLAKLPTKAISTRSWPVMERYQLIWLWIGDGDPAHPVPDVPALTDQKIVCSLGKGFKKNCHPNVVMVNAIDEQHFHTVHKLPGSILHMEPHSLSHYHIRFTNTGRVPTTTWYSRWISRFYKGPLTYELNYWYGHMGTVTFGPDFLHLYIMFALRQTADGKTEGQTLVFTKHRKGIMGWLVNAVILFLTKLGGRYFAIGDTRIFQTIQFHFKTPISSDRAILFFLKHVEQLKCVNWRSAKTPSATSEVI